MELAAESTAPAFGFASQFPLPSDYLRMLPSADNKDWQIEGRKILTDDSSPIQVVYLKKITDLNELDELFVEVLVARIAYTIAEKVTQSNTKKQAAGAYYDEMKKEAKRVNAFERPPQDPPVDDWVTARL